MHWLPCLVRLRRSLPGLVLVLIPLAGLQRADGAEPPSLSIQSTTTTGIRLSWPATAASFALEQTASLTPPTQWQAVTQAPIAQGGELFVELPSANQTRFFRLVGAPLPPVTTVRETSPAHGETGVAVTRETILRLSGPLAPTTTVGNAQLYAEFAGRKLLSRIQISSDHRTLTLFYLEPLPGNARVRVTLRGDLLIDESGLPVDVDGDGLPGGDGLIEFDTLGITGVPGTAVIGRVFASEKNPDGSNKPLQNVTVTVDGAEQTLRATTDPLGNFRLEPAPAGRFFVSVDGRTAVDSQWPNGAYYPFVGKAWEAIAGKADNLAGGSGEIFLPFIRPETLQPISTTADTTIRFPSDVIAANPALDGVSITVPANSLFSNDGTRGGRVGIAPVPPDRLPEPLPPGLEFPLVITVQTDGPTNFDVPVPVRFPNLPDPVTGQLLPPGAKSALWSFNHDTGRWEVQGSMTISADGKFAVSDPGVGIRQPGWHAPSPAVPGNPSGPNGPFASSSFGPVPGGPGCPPSSPASAPPPAPSYIIRVEVATAGNSGENDNCTNCVTATLGRIYVGPGAPASSASAMVSCPPASGPSTPAPSPTSPTTSQPPRSSPPQPGPPLFAVQATNVLFYADGQAVEFRFRNTATGPNAPDLFFVCKVEGPAGAFLNGANDVTFHRAAGQTAYWNINTKAFAPLMNPQNATPPVFVERDRLYLVRITTEVKKASDQSVLGTFQHFIARYVDASDADPNDGTLDFTDTISGGRSQRLVDHIHPASLRPGFTVPGGITHFKVDASRHLSFEPIRDEAGQTGELLISAPTGGRIGSLTLRGEGLINVFRLNIAPGQPGNLADALVNVGSTLSAASVESVIRRELNLLGIVPNTTSIDPTYAVKSPLGFTEGRPELGAEFVDIQVDFSSALNPGGPGYTGWSWPYVRSGGQHYILKDHDFQVDPGTLLSAVMNAPNVRNSAQTAFLLSRALNTHRTTPEVVNVPLLAIRSHLSAVSANSAEDFGKELAYYIAQGLGFHVGLLESGYDFRDSDNQDSRSRHLVDTSLFSCPIGTDVMWRYGGDAVCVPEAWRVASGIATAVEYERAFAYFRSAYDRGGFLQPDFFEGTAGYVRGPVILMSPPALPDVSARPASPMLIAPDTGHSISRGDFGLVNVDGSGGAQASLEVELRNIGGQPLRVSSVVLQTRADFALTDSITSGTIIPGGLGARVRVVFDPRVAGEHLANVIFETDAERRVLHLTGQGVRNAGQLHVAVNQNNAGGVGVSAPGVTVPDFARLDNVGSAPLRISAVRIRDGGGQFSVTGLAAGGTSLAPGSGLDLQLTFDPGAVGLHTSWIDVESNDPDSSVTTFTVVGTGLPDAGPAPQWGDDFILIQTGGSASRLRSDAQGNFFAYLPPGQPYTVEAYDPVSGLVWFSADVTETNATPAQFGIPVFRASTADDANFNGLPDDVDRILGPGFRFDFGTDASPVAPGYTRATPAPYDTGRGFGWSPGGSVLAQDSGTGSALERDFNETTDATFLVDLAEGIHEVTVTLAPGTQDTEIHLEGDLHGSLSLIVTGLSHRTVRVAVRDGQLTVRLRSISGTPVRLASLVIAPVLLGPVNPPGETLSGSFVTMIENVATGVRVRRDQVVGPGGSFATEMLTPNTTYRQWAIHKLTRQVAFSEFTSLAPGAPVPLPVLAFGPSNAPDSDGDGLDDIAEFILGTNVDNADTDGDGARDGAELQLDRDPLVPDTLPARILAAAETFGNATDVAATDNFVAVADRFSGISLFNTFGNLPPVLVAQIPNEAPGTSSRVAASERWVIYADGPIGAGVLDVLSANPALATRLLVGGTVTAVAAEGSLALAGTQEGEVLLVSLPLKTVLRRFTVGVEVRDLMLRGGIGYVLTPTGLRTLTVRPEGISALGSVQAPQAESLVYQRLSLGAGQVFATFDSDVESIPSGFAIFDVANPVSPSLNKSYVTEVPGWRHVVPDGAGRLLANVTPDSQGDFAVYDFSDSTQLGALLSSVSAGGSVNALALRNGLVFLAVGSSTAGLQLVQFTEGGTGGTAPTVTLATSLGAQGAVEGQLFNARTTATDDVLTSAVEFYVNGTLAARDTAFPFEVTLAAPRMSGNAAFSVEARAFDTAGNRGSVTQTFPLMRDTSAPTVLFSGPSANGTAQNVRTVGVFLSEPLDTASLTRNTFFLQNAGADGVFGTTDDSTVPNGAITTDALAGAAYLTFASDMPVGNYRLVLGAGARDVAGNTLPATFTADWKVRQGLLGEYYADNALTDLRLIRNDTAIDFIWPGSPAPGTPTNQFSIRWRGRLVGKITGDVRFYNGLRQGNTRVWLDGNLVTEDFFNGYSGRTFPMVSGQTYNLVVEYVDTDVNRFGAPNQVMLRWTDNPFDDRIANTIPATYFLPPLDTTPPALLAAEADPSFVRVRLRFSESLDPATANNRTNYSLGAAAQILSATLQSNRTEVVLATSRLPEAARHTVTVTGVRDASEQANVVAAGTSLSFHTLGAGTGFVRYETPHVTEFSQYTAEELSSFFRLVDTISLRPGFEAPVYPVNTGPNAHRLAGYVIPPVTGEYRFYLSADSRSWLYLSTNDDPQSARLIAREPEGVASRRAWVFTGGFGRAAQNPENRSEPVTLTAGNRYYIEAIAYGPNSVNNYFGVAWQIPGAAALRNNDPPIAAQHLATFAAPDARGFHQRETFANIGGTNVTDVTSHPSFPNAPASLEFSSLLRRVEPGQDAKDGGVRWSGYLTPPVSGLVRFWLDANMPGSFRLSTNADPANLREVMLDGRAYRGGGQGNWHQFFRVPQRDGPAPRGEVMVQAGQPHYFELLVKTLGPDTLGFQERVQMGLNWTLPGQLDSASGPQPLPANFVATMSDAAPLGFARPPASQTIIEESPVTFVGVPSGAPPFLFQWFSNNVAIAGATNPVYALPSVQFAWSGARFTLAVTNLFGSVISAPAVLTVPRELTPPKMISGRGAASLERAYLVFDEPLATNSVTNVQNYAVSGGLQVLSARALADRMTVELVTTRQTPATAYTVSVSGVTDDAPLRNVIATGNQIAFTAFSLSPHFLNREVFTEVAGSTVSNLTNNVKFPHRPDVEGYVSSFEGPNNFANTYGSRLFGLLAPPETGNYTFYLAADDQAELWLSDSETPVGKRLIAREPAPAPSARNWTGTANRPNGENISAVIALTAGRRYYVEVLQKENGTTDFVGVNWKLPSQTAAPTNNAPPIASTHIIGYADPVGASVQIMKDLPESDTPSYNQGFGAILEVAATGTRTPLVYQWQRNGVVIPGATSARYITPALTREDNGAKYRCRIAIPGAVLFSREKTIRVF